MGGSSASVLLPRPLTQAEREEIRASVSLESNHLIEAHFPGHDYSIFIDEFTEIHRAKIDETFGLMWTTKVELDAIVSGSESNRILGQITVRLAEHYGGITDFGGVLWPSAAGDKWRGHGNTEWHDIEREVMAILGELPGRLIALPYKTARDTQWAVHYGDARFLRAWLEHPHFHMIK